MTNQANLRKEVTISVTQHDIDEGKCKNPNKCMIKLAVARAINIPHGYIKVDATGISITRRNDYREKSFLSHNAIVNMLRFDQNKEVRPFRFKAVFHKTSKVYKASDHRQKQVNAARKKRIAEGRPDKKYNLHQRIAGVAIDKELAAEINQGR